MYFIYFVYASRSLKTCQKEENVLKETQTNVRPFSMKDKIGVTLGAVSYTHLDVYKRQEQSRPLGKEKLFFSHIAGGGAAFDIDNFQFMMPVPVNTMKVKIPDVFQIITKRKTFRTVGSSFAKSIVGNNVWIILLWFHGLIFSISVFWDIILYLYDIMQ